MPRVRVQMASAYQPRRARRDAMAGPKREQFGQPLMKIMSDTSISLPARFAYCVLSGATDAKTGECRMSVSGLAKRLGIARQNTQRYVAELERRGVIVRLSRNTQSARWRVPTGGAFWDGLPRQHDKLNGNLTRQHDKHLPRQHGTIIENLSEGFDHKKSARHFPVSQGNDKGVDLVSNPPTRVITDRQERELIEAQERLDAKRARSGQYGKVYPPKR